MYKKLKVLHLLLLIQGVALSTSYSYEEKLVNNGATFYAPKFRRHEERKLILPQLTTLFIPGFDQWWEGQVLPAASYTAAGAAGLALYFNSKPTLDNRYRNFGMSLYLTAGSLSLFHSFHTALSTHRTLGTGAFKYIVVDETPYDLITAPFRSRYLERPTTLIPLTLGAIIYVLLSPKNSGGSVSFNDFVYSHGISYLTGVGEEALFRGYVMPMAMYYTENELASIGISAGTFALAHGLRFNHLIGALLFGAYSGWLTQNNHWMIGESIFIHTWWDVMAFITDYANKRESAVLRLPTIQIQF